MSELPLNKKSDETRSKLIRTAIGMMARQGIHAVSLRSINSAAGCLNASAAHYHFGGKQGLVDAALDHVLSPVVRDGAPLFEALERRLADGGEISIRDVLEAGCLPFLALMLKPEYGPDACQFIARAMLEADEEIQESLNALGGQLVLRMAPLLGRLLPDMPPLILAFRIVLLPLTLIYATNQVKVLYSSPLGSVAPGTPVEMLSRLFECIEGSFTGPWREGVDEGLAERFAALL